MLSPTSLLLVVTVMIGGLGACAGSQRASQATTTCGTGMRGHLLIIGGGLDDDNKPVYQRFVALARAHAGHESPHVLIVTAASGDQPANITGKTESIRAYCPTCVIESITRETAGDQTVALVDAAHAMFFTGGDQKRITDRYLDPQGYDTPEAAAMRRMLQRGGVIAGTSAGDAMMSDPMFLTGRSAEALGIRSTRASDAADDDADDKRPERPLGPQIGKGMGFLPWAVTDSHFFERHRFGRLVAALESSGKRLGLGVGEDACVEVNLSTGDLIGISVADSLLVDVGSLSREGLVRRGVRTRIIRQGMRLSMPDLLATTPTLAAGSRPALLEDMPVVEPGQNRQLASWRFFSRAETDAAALRLKLDGYEQVAWRAGDGGSVVEIGPR